MVVGMIDLEDVEALFLWTTRKSNRNLALWDISWWGDYSDQGWIHIRHMWPLEGFTVKRLLCFYGDSTCPKIPMVCLSNFLVKTCWLTDTWLQHQNPKRRQPEFSKPISLRLLPEIQLHNLPVRLLLSLHNVGQFLPQMLTQQGRQHPFCLKERISCGNRLWEMMGYRLGLRWLAHLMRRPFPRNGNRCAAKCKTSLLPESNNLTVEVDTI